MQLTRMAWRNVWRNKRRSWVTIVAMALGLWVMIGYAGLVRGYLHQMERQILDVEVGDVQVHAPGFRDDPSLYRRIDDAAAIGERLGVAGFRASARLLGAGLAAAEDNSSGAQLIGVDVAKDAQVSAVHDAVDKGQWLDPKEPAGVVVGRYLARTLELAPGDELVLLSQASDGSMANDLYRVRGILGPVGGGVDRGGVFLTEAAFRELMGVPTGAHRIIVRAPEGMPLPAAKAGVVAAAGEAEVTTAMNTSTLAAMAWRNIWRNRRRTLVTLASIIFGTFLAVFLTGMGDATYGKMIDTAAKMGNGHVTVQHRLQTEAPAPKRFVRGATGLAAQVVQTPGVRGAAARIMATAMVAAGGESRGAALIGIDVGSESKDSLATLGGVAEGALFAQDDTHGALLGADLARHLGVELGSKVVFTLTDRNGEIVTGLLRVRGLLQTGSPDADSGLVIAPLQTLQKALGYGPEDATLVAVLVDDQRATASVARAPHPLQNGDRAVLTATLLSALLPAWIAGRVNPTTAIKLV